MPIVKWVAEVMGWLMNGIYSIGVTNLGLCIILFTIIIYMFMTPLQIKQQKFSKMNAVMSPELQKINKKYKGKKDQNSQMKMQEETMAVYEKYGVSPTGSCLQMVIQMPIFFALYQVIIKMPGYIGGIKHMFDSAVVKQVLTDMWELSVILLKSMVSEVIAGLQTARVSMIIMSSTFYTVCPPPSGQSLVMWTSSADLPRL